MAQRLQVQFKEREAPKPDPTFDAYIGMRAAFRSTRELFIQRFVEGVRLKLSAASINYYADELRRANDSQIHVEKMFNPEDNL